MGEKKKGCFIFTSLRRMRAVQSWISTVIGFALYILPFANLSSPYQHTLSFIFLPCTFISAIY